MLGQCRVCWAHPPQTVDEMDISYKSCILQAKGKERQWLKHQTHGDLDEAKLIEGLTGERAIYRRRGEKEPEVFISVGPTLNHNAYAALQSQKADMLTLKVSRYYLLAL